METDTPIVTTVADKLRNQIEDFKGRFKENYKIRFSERNTIVCDKSDSIQNTKDLRVKEDILREVIFYNDTLKAVKKGLKKLEIEKIKIWRPNDFYAEMFKSDEKMDQVKGRLEK